MKPCPECGEPPHYHSWCTLCAQLFRVKPKPEPQPKFKWNGHNTAMSIAVRLAFAQQMTEAEAARKIGCHPATVHRWRLALGLPAFKRKLNQERFHALAS